MPLAPCPRCGKAEKKWHACTGSLDPTEDARKSAKRQQFRDSRGMSMIEVEEEVRDKLNEIRAHLRRETGKTRVTYSDAVRFLIARES